MERSISTDKSVCRLTWCDKSRIQNEAVIVKWDLKEGGAGPKRIEVKAQLTQGTEKKRMGKRK